ncbi:tRNA (guanosine(37)-N1)-methyltransferase TrmD [Deltaproteobacteria bacterium Smac51]|nr:tRNA (guanosine(37)-N1)-methyltransferase TrmD [Deltaproteobacteria bacterium Smac51]
MRFDIITIFPDLFTSFLSESLMAKAIEKKVLEVKLHTPRDYTSDRHHTADDRPYGGGPGMVLKPEPMAAAIEAAGRGRIKPWRVYMSPSGTRLTQDKVFELAGKKRLMLICGRYEGLDQRVIDLLVDEEISIGDYVVNGGEVPAMAVMEAVARLQPGFMGKPESADEESHQSGLLEYPHYTRPPVFRDLEVPKILLSGNHKEVAEWRRRAALARTLAQRPEMLARAELPPEAVKALSNIHTYEHQVNERGAGKKAGS